MQVSVETTSSIERHMTIGVPAQEIDKAIACLDTLPDNTYKDAMLTLARFAIERSY